MLKEIQYLYIYIYDNQVIYICMITKSRFKTRVHQVSNKTRMNNHFKDCTLFKWANLASTVINIIPLNTWLIQNFLFNSFPDWFWFFDFHSYTAIKIKWHCLSLLFEPISKPRTYSVILLRCSPLFCFILQFWVFLFLFIPWTNLSGPCKTV